MMTADNVVVVRALVAPLQAADSVNAPQVSQVLRGHPARALETSRGGDWLRVRCADAYEGWLHHGYVHSESRPVHLPADRGWLERASPAVLLEWPSGVRVSLGCRIESAGARLHLPPGALVAPDENLAGGEALEPHILRARLAADPASVARTAAKLFAGAPYQWGGVTPWGVDCSGLVQTAFALHGLPLPRDAWQQAEACAASRNTPTSADAGELLFFSGSDDGRITHVGIALGGARMLHAAIGRGGWAVEDWRLEESDPYLAKLGRTFRSAGRVVS